MTVKQRLIASSIGAPACGLGVGLGAGSAIAAVVTALVAFPVLYLTMPWFARRPVNVRLPPSELVAREASGSRTSVREGVGFFLMVCTRGLALWIVWPLAFAVWVLHGPVRYVRDRPLRLPQVAGWFDTNLIALLESTVLRPFFPHRTHFVRWSRAAGIKAGPSVLDPW